MTIRDAFRAIVDRLPDAMLLISLDGEIVAANRAAGELLGQPASALPGRSLAELVDDGARLERHLQLWRRSGQPMPVALRLRADTGVPIECRADGYALSAETSERVLLVRLRAKSAELTSREFAMLNERVAQLARELDLHRHLQAQQSELLRRETRAREAAEEANRIKDEFLATLSHELRTPLTSAYGWIRLIEAQDGGEGPPVDLKHAIMVIGRSLDMQLRLVNDLLDISALEMGKLRIDTQRLDLAEVVREEVESFKAVIADNGLVLNVTCHAPLAIHGDRARMRQVVANLLTNAMKFTPAGGQVDVVADCAPPSHVRLVVRDTGRGIAPAFLPYVFDKFRQAEASTTRRVGGIGLGLTLVRSIVELHGGLITAASDGDGKGATFTVTLPAAGGGGER